MLVTHYRIAALDPRAHVFQVSCTVPDPDPAGQLFRSPAWVPGSYLIREFARHFHAAHGACGETPVKVKKIAKDVWRADPCAGPLTFTADVYAFDLSVRAAYLDAVRGYFNGASVFAWPVGREDRPCELDIVAPVVEACRDWRVATSLPRCGAEAYGFGRYRASNYDELIDHPVEMGTFILARFDAGGARHDIAIAGRQRADLARLARDLQRVCQTQIDLFGGAANSRAPVDYYLFQILAVGDGYGGLEHRASTSLICKRDELPQPAASGVSDDYRNFLGLASHEYFHTWNVKRIKPASFAPYDLTRENYTQQLWAFEGITSYYDDLALVRSGVIGSTDYLELLGRNISALLRTPGRTRQSVAESSFDAWIKYYRPDENAPNAIVSYYVKGALIALALDLTLRLETAVSLDDIMRALWRRYGGAAGGVPEGGIEALVAELAGRDFSAFFADYVYGTKELPLAALLQAFGVELNLRAAEGGKDKGGRPSNDAPRLWLGATLDRSAEIRLKHVMVGGPAARAGLASGDTIIAIDGLRASVEGLERLLKSREPNAIITIHAFRRDELMTFTVELDAAPEDTCWLVVTDDATPEMLARRAAWLSGTTLP